MSSIYDEPDFSEEEPVAAKPKKARKKTVVKKPAAKKVAPKKKKPAKKQPVKKKVSKKQPSVRARLAKPGEKPSKFALEMLARGQKAAEKEVKMHLDAGRDVSGMRNGVRGVIKADTRKWEPSEEPKDTKPVESPAEVKPEKPTITAEEFFASVKPVPEYIKHLVECRCELAQFRTMDSPPNHKFIVFSELDELGNVRHSYVQCNNCGIIHKVVEFNTSQTIKKESLMSMENIEDIKLELPDWLVVQLEKYDCDIHVWQEGRFIFKHELWGRFILLSKEREESTVFGKICQILGKELYKIEVFEQDENDLEVSF